jgi:hypothetical protein
MGIVDRIITEVERRGSCEITPEIENILCCDLVLPELRLRGYSIVTKKQHIVKDHS